MGVDLQSVAGREDEQVQCYTDYGRHFERLGQGEGDPHHIGRVPQPDREAARRPGVEGALHRHGPVQGTEAADHSRAAQVRR